MARDPHKFLAGFSTSVHVITRRRYSRSTLRRLPAKRDSMTCGVVVAACQMQGDTEGHKEQVLNFHGLEKLVPNSARLQNAAIVAKFSILTACRWRSQMD